MSLPSPRRRDLGQHFLVDENIVRVAGRMAMIAPEDVVLEVGPGLGVLTAYLADHVDHVHAVEIDDGLVPHLRQRLAGKDNVNLVVADALRYPLAQLEPQPHKFVSNLPYNVATPLVVESLDGLPSLELWCVMVQREVADRFFAGPGTKDYGAVSVVVQLTANRTGLHPVSRSVFKPPPNVDSALVAFARRRQWGSEYAALKELIQAAFAHRRKTLANSLELSGFERPRVETALEVMELPPAVRAEQLAPADFETLAGRLS